ncbi:MAG TPA: PilZ domain-containing protein [Dissulfurispiraceae bacterium]|nr:PilZ domain-containing protein [Dissulfurispiraceae bacterium]
MSERRSHLRFRAKGFIILKPSGGRLAEVRGSMHDLSFKGIGITAQHEIEVGVRVAVELLDVAPLKGRIAFGDGEVVSVMSLRRGETPLFRICVRFVNVDQTLLQRLLLAIRRQPNQALKRPGAVAAHPRRNGRCL